MHNVYARIVVPATDDGATWLSTDIEAMIIDIVNPSELEVTVETIMEGDDADDIDNLEAVEINFVSSDDARSLAIDMELILVRHEPVDWLVEVN